MILNSVVRVVKDVWDRVALFLIRYHCIIWIPFFSAPFISSKIKIDIALSRIPIVMVTLLRRRVSLPVFILIL